MTITINVTQRDIDRGLANDCHRCPIARAMSRQLGGVKVAASEDAILARGCKYYSPDAAEFMVEFDLGIPVQPARFTLRRLSPLPSTEQA